MKRFSFLLIALFSLLSTSNVKAHDFEVDGIYYNITSNEEQTVEVTYKGDSYLFSDVYTGTIVIPETVIYNEITYRVTGVGTNAFTKAYFGNNEERKGPEIVEIPNTVHYIGDGAFSGCTGLKTVEMSNSTISIGTSAFQYCHNLASFIIENNITHIGDKAFYNCNNLNCAISAIVGNNTTYIGEDAFYECVNLTGKLIIPESITDISSSAFSGCSSITSVEIPSSVTSIGEWAFSGCSGITSVEIPNSVTSIGESAFYGCSGIKTVINFSNLTFSKGSSNNGYVAYYADNVHNAPNGSIIDDFIFGEVECVNTLIKYIGYSTEILLPEKYKDGAYAIGSSAFKNCSNITSILLPDCITHIGERAFENCSKLTSIEIPNSVTSIGSSAFSSCTSLTDIVIPNGVTRIEDFTFSNCKSLQNVTIPSSVTGIGIRAFQNCNNLISIRSFIPAENLFELDTRYGWSAVFDGANTNTCILYVPHNALDTYKTTNGWSDFKNIEELKYRITYIVNGEVYTTRDLAYGAEIPVDIKEGYTFVCNDLPSSMPAEDITISGSFTVNNYTVTYIVDGEVYKTVNVVYGADVVLIVEPTKEGHTFSGWSEAPSTMPAEDITISGSFTVNNYTITYIVDGEVYKTVGVAYGTDVVLIDEPTKEGHTFSGWSEAPSTMPAEDITISGSFTVNNYTVTYIVDGEVYKTVSVVYGADIVLIDEPTKEGHTFSGWSEAPSTMPAEDITISGSFTVNNYTVTYIVDGEVYKTVGVAYGTDVVLIDEPTKEGHTFSGWSEAPSTMPAEDITISGSFTVNSYTVTFTVDGEVYKTMSVEYGKEIPTVETPTKEGRKFSGWSEIPSTMPAKNVNVEGGFCYTIIYMLDGKYYNSSEIYYGSVIKAPAEPPHKEGHTFVEWGNLPATMPARDMTIHAVYSVNKYQLIFIIDGEVYETLYVEYGSKIEYPQKEGYIIIWETENLPETMPAENLIIIGRSTLDTAIKAINEESSDYTIYTLDGHRVMDIENLRSGFYIINGKKVFVK